MARALLGNGPVNTPRYTDAKMERGYTTRFYAPARWTDFRAGAMTSNSNCTSYHATCFLCCPCGAYITNTYFKLELVINSKYFTVIWLPCRGGVEYFLRSPASRRRRRKGKSRIWDSKYGGESRGTRTQELLYWRAPAAIVNDRPVLSSESAPHQQTRNCLTVNKDLVVSPRWVLYSKIDWTTDRRPWHKTQTQTQLELVEK
jgi:hypothetical protein